MKKIILPVRLWLLLLLLTPLTGLVAHTQSVLSERDQSKIVDEVLEERFTSVLPELMQRTGIDMWILISREYNEDPVLRTMLPSTWLSARRTTMLVFSYDATLKKVDRQAIARYDVGSAIKAAWDMKKFPDQWDALIDLIEQKKPMRIGINTSAHFGHADGLDHTHYEMLMRKLPATFKSRVVSAEPLAVGWLETRTPREINYYQKLVAITHEIIAEAFSSKVVTPGITTTDDLVWWFRQRITSLGLSTWFHPSVSVQRSDSVNFEHLRSFSNRPKDEVIIPGDLLHVDIGITYLRLNTDIQQHAYVLRPDELDAPASLKKAFASSNRLQDILTAQFTSGKTGNQILAAALAQAKTEGIKPSIYTHPLGLHGHAAGPTIGLWDQQQGVPGSGDYPVFSNTAYSIELNSATFVSEWGKEVRIMLEEDGYYDGKVFRYIGGRQQQLRIIKYF